MWRRLGTLLAICVILPALLGADAISLATLTANPNNLAGNIKGEGTFSVDPQRSFVNIHLRCVQDSTGTLFIGSNVGTVNPPNWERFRNSLPAPDTYTCTGRLITFDQQYQQHFTDTASAGIALPF